MHPSSVRSNASRARDCDAYAADMVCDGCYFAAAEAIGESHVFWILALTDFLRWARR
jgi:hypothetical protein